MTVLRNLSFWKLMGEPLVGPNNFMGDLIGPFIRCQFNDDQ